MGEVLKTSERACTVRAHLGWKGHEAPRSKYYNSTPSPHVWKKSFKKVRGPAQREFILLGSTMKHHKENILRKHPLPPWIGKVLETSKGLHRKSLKYFHEGSIKHHGLNISNPSPPPMDGRGI